MRKVALQKYGVEEKRLRTVEHFDGCGPFSAADVLTAIIGVREYSLSSHTSKEAEDLLGEFAGLLNWVEKLRWRASEFTSKLPVRADKEGGTVSWVWIAAMS
jgi:hypothetical protein